MPKVITASALALLLWALPHAAADTALLGGLVTTGTFESEETGLIDIEGIHSSLWDMELPWVTDMQLYLRWEGEGTHDLMIELADLEGGEPLASLEDELDLEDFATSYTTYELSNVIFERPGFYDVLVYLDGELAFEVPYCVNVADEDYPTDPYLLASIPAVDGWMDDEGLGLVQGAFELFTFGKFPASDDFAIVTLWFSGDGTWSHRAELRDPDGNVVARSEPQDLDAWPGEMAVMTDYFDNVLFRTAGDYAVAIFLDDEEIMSYMLRVAAE